MSRTRVGGADPSPRGTGSSGGVALPKGFRTGTHRSIPPEQTVARLMPLLPAFGITRVANITGLDTLGLPVTLVCRPNSRSLAVSQGKGLSLAAAQASGLMESIESFHAERILAPLKLASFNELRFSHPLVDVEALPRASTGNFHPQLRLLWIEGTELSSHSPVWLPLELVHGNYTLPLPPGSGSFLLSSNGLASGNHLLEAISHGLCEVVERDASTLWLLGTSSARQRSQVALETVDDPACRQVLERFERAGVEVAVWEMTSDIGIPAFMSAVLEPRDSFRPLGPALGQGCHPAREVALLRALTEAAQSRLTTISGSRDDVGRRHYEPVRTQGWSKQVREWMSARPRRAFHEAPSWQAVSLDEDVAWELDRLRSAGFAQVVVVDLTRPEFQIPVARVVIPGLEGPSAVAAYAPGARARRHLEARRA